MAKSESTKKHTPKFNDLERVMAKKEIARLILQGKHQAEIAASVVINGKTITQQMVSYYLTQLENEYKAEAMKDITVAKAIHLAKTNHLYQEYLAGFERSKMEKTHKKSGKKNTKNKESKQAQIQQWTQNGDSRFLDGALDTLQHEAAIQGYNSPKKLDITSPKILIIEDGDEGKPQRSKN